MIESIKRVPGILVEEYVFDREAVLMKAVKEAIGEVLPSATTAYKYECDFEVIVRCTSRLKEAA